MAKPTDELMDHSYDGIKEFNNPLPKWWLYLFLICILWAVLYMFYYHFAGMGDSQSAEYAKEMKAHEEMLLAKNASGTADMILTKADLTVLTDKGSLEAGKEVFMKNCVSCHGKFGEGNVGPNLTDDYWIHGGTFENIATTIMNGVPEKGMITWKALLKKAEILKVASYIKTLKGTNPPNPKAPQGVLFNEGAN